MLDTSAPIKVAPATPLKSPYVRRQLLPDTQTETLPTSQTVSQGKIFWYWGIEKDSADFDRFESAVENLTEIVKTVRDSSFNKDIFQWWFLRSERPAVNRVFELLQKPTFLALPVVITVEIQGSG